MEHSTFFLLYFCGLFWHIRLPVEVNFVNFWVVVLDLGVCVADEDGVVGQETLNRKYFGEAADVVANPIHQTLHTWQTQQFTTV